MARPYIPANKSMELPEAILLPTDYQAFIHLSRYARWNEDAGRRETWEETVTRVKEFWLDRFPEKSAKIEEAFLAVLNLEVMPSMRTMMSAGKALDRDNVAGFNCAATAIDKPRKFDEVLYILMCGTGMGFSVERQFINKLPEVAEEFYETATTIVVADSKIGWSKAYRELISLLFQGQIPHWDVHKVRPAGARLKTMGGRASGPDPLVELFEFTIAKFRGAKGRKLTSLECHDVVCKIAEVVVVGGVRRSALISLSNLTDERMRVAKSGQWWEDNPQRALSNNSVAYTEKPDIGVFMREWKSLYMSKSGERGVFNREAAQRLLPERRAELGKHDWLCNPCSEIVLRNSQFCNLTEVVIRPDDTLRSLKRKVRLATFIGTLQSSLTNFRYLSKEWQKNTEDEALLGVSLTGIMDHYLLGDVKAKFLPSWLKTLKETAQQENKEQCKSIGVNASTAITCVKPSGTVSQLVDSSSGIHTRFSLYYIRTVRADNKDPLAKMMIQKGFPYEVDVMKQGSGLIFSFPVKAPKNAVVTNDVNAIDQLELWKMYQLNYTEHKPSVTVFVKEDEWMKVGAWVYENFAICSGVSFLPFSDHVYKQAPYQAITEKEYKEALSTMPKNVNWDDLGEYEKDDAALTNTKELACTAGGCEI